MSEYVERIQHIRDVATAKFGEVSVPKSLATAMEAVDKIVAERIHQDNFTLDQLIEQLRISEYTYVMTKHYTIADQRKVIAMNTLISEGLSVSASEHLADEAFPMANVLRRRIRQANKVFDGIRSEISTKKAELGAQLAERA